MKKTCLNVDCPERYGGKCSPVSDTDRSDLFEKLSSIFTVARQKARLELGDPHKYVEEQLSALFGRQFKEAYNKGWADGWAKRSQDEDYSAVVGKLKIMKPQENAFFVIGEIERVVAELQAQANETEKE